MQLTTINDNYLKLIEFQLRQVHTFLIILITVLFVLSVQLYFLSKKSSLLYQYLLHKLEVIYY